MQYTCACGKKFKHQSTLSQHGRGKGTYKQACPQYMERKGRGEKVNVTVTNNIINGNQDNSTNDNSTNDNSVTNNITNNIQLNGFGKEDISNITREILEQLFKGPKSSLVRLFEKIWELPENRNIKNTDPSRPMLRVYDGDEWKRMDKKRTLNNLIGHLQEIWKKYVKDNKIHIHRLRDDEFYNRVYKIDQLMLQMERIKLNGVIVSNS